MAKTLTTQAAAKLFQQFIEHPQLTWDQISTGCESRADLMAEIAVEKGIEVSKIWIEISPGSEGVFSIYLNNAKTEMAFCKYHVAIVLNVGDESSSELLVIDPAFFDTPVSRDTWVERLSIRSNEYGYQTEVSISDWRNFYSPEQMIYARDGALKKRAELLELSKNLENSTVLIGVFALARGKWVDSLSEVDPQKFKELQSIYMGSNYEMWFKGTENNLSLENWLRSHPYYFGLPSSQLLETIDFSDRLAALEVRKQYWQYMRDLFHLLTQKRDELVSGTTPLSQLFKTLWEDDEEADAEWFGADSLELWNKFGLDLQAEISLVRS